jgi:hypothetical protein
MVRKAAGRAVEKARYGEEGDGGSDDFGDDDFW